jgi:hypothetical protein
MGEIRTSEKNAKQLLTLSETKDLKQALEIMVDLKGKVYEEEKRVIKYDSKTGQPKEYKWVPYKKFKDNFTFGGKSFGGTINVKLQKDIIEKIKKGCISFNKNGKSYVAQFKEIDHSGSSYDGYHHCIEYVISIKKTRNI